jgi:hypothetical protein
MSLENNPDELFGKPLSVYPVTNLTPQTPPEPPAAGELSDEQLLQMAAVAVGFKSLANSPLTGFIGSVEAFRPELITYARAAIAADRAQRSRQEQQKWEANRRLWQCLVNGDSFDSQVVKGIRDWIDAGMTGPLPPLPEYLTNREEQP